MTFIYFTLYSVYDIIIIDILIKFIKGEHMAILKKQSLVDQIYDEIKKQIIELIIPLGSKLNVSELQDKFGVRKMKRNLKESILKTF